jgi:hypothetical protein
MPSKPILVGAALTACATLCAERAARACGCFAPPNGAELVVQAGERILFSVASGEVTAAIQIRYAGPAKDFGWILPLPSVPTLDLGTDELFSKLSANTAPRYYLTQHYDGACPTYSDAGAVVDANATVDAGAPPAPIVVEEASIGPYDYAVLKADDKQALLDWLDASHYFVPVGTDDVVGPYIHKGAYFLALKLHSGAQTGDLQPVVVHYASDLPMIPIELTSVTAQPDMPVQVWMLGSGRAIPRNYYHTVLDDAAIDWLSGGSNYNDVVIRATKEAPGRHTFITEYAGTSGVMNAALYWSGRFGTRAELAAQPDAVSFVAYLNQHGYPANATPYGGGPYNSYFVYTSAFTAVLAKALPPPPMYAWMEPASFFGQLSYLAQLDPHSFVGWPASYDPANIADELDARVVQPTRAAQKLFDASPVLTRLITTLSPAQMDRDPVFSYSHRLPSVGNDHVGQVTYHCDLRGSRRTTVVTEDGWVIELPLAKPSLPASRRIEILTEELDPASVVDNDAMILAALTPDPMPDAAVLDARPASDARQQADALIGRDAGSADRGDGCRVAGNRGGGAWLALVLVAARIRRRKG